VATESIADAYVRAINAGDVDGVVALFAPEAVLRNPAGTFEGLEQIRSFYESVVIAGRARLTVRSVTRNDDGTVTAELVATSPLGEPGNEINAVDDFVLDDDGHIRALDIVYR
jgi:steroid delta-isomerase